MDRRRCWMGALAAWLIALGSGPRVAPAAPPEDAKALTRAIDEWVAARWAEAKVEPAGPAADAEFLRRAYLDLAGKIPRVSEARAFLDDPAPDKRARLVDRLLAAPTYATHLTHVWRALLVPEASSDLYLRFQMPDFEAWLRDKFERNVGYDKLVREVVSTRLGAEEPSRQGFGAYGGAGAKTPLAFYAAKKGKPEELAASTARLFLGVRIECAQCHDHPFARWTREQFWSYAAFFGGVHKQGPEDQAFGSILERTDRRELAVPGTEKVVQAAFLDGGEPQWRYQVGPRSTLADWMTAADNPYFARAAANRVWALLFGVGLVDPVDDMGEDNPPSHPELLDELARQLAAHDFDLKFLFRALMASRAYQLSGAGAPGASAGPEDPRLFARKAMKGLTAEQLYDSLAEATGYAAGKDDSPFVFYQDNPRRDFLERFAAADEKPTDHQTSILHALALMNGRIVADSTSLERGATLGAVADLPFLDTAGRIEALYLAALARRPRPEEAERLKLYVERGGPSGHPEKALADVFWALLNSSEFLLNH